MKGIGYKAFTHTILKTSIRVVNALHLTGVNPEKT